MTDWQDWIAVGVVLWAAWRVVGEIVKPFLTASCTGCGSACEKKTNRENLLSIE